MCMQPSSISALLAGLTIVGSGRLARPDAVPACSKVPETALTHSTAFVDLKQAYVSMQHPLLRASSQRKELHSKLLAAMHSLYTGKTMRMKVCGSCDPQA